MIKEIIVVEGKEDTRRLKEIFPDIQTIETRGSAIDDTTIALIKKAQETRGVIIFTDPDYPGKRIRTIINQHVPGCKNAYVEKAKAISIKKKKVGVEHCTTEDIKAALLNLTEVNIQESDVTFSDLVNLGLIGGSQSNLLRNFISQELNIGHNNAKQFHNKVKVFNLSLDTLKALIKKYNTSGRNVE
jgi:ribonuclease M5